MGETIRLDKLLAEMGCGSRTQIKELIRKGNVLVNGEIIKKPESRINTDKDDIVCCGKEISYTKYEYYMLNKPDGVVSATADNLHRTVIDLIAGKKRNDLFPVGRLDIDTEGLLLITNDGELAHRLLSPKKHVDKVYYALVGGKLPENAAELFKQGIELEDGTRLMPAELEVISFSEEKSEILLTIHEGKFHQVKRMFEAAGCHVEYLKRMSMGILKLDENLKTGEYRHLSQEEIQQLKE